MKKFIKKFINKLGYDLKKFDPQHQQIDFDDLLRSKIQKDPIIFDIGGNKGQSVEKYLKIFNNPIIHSFEPIKKEFDHMFEKFNNFNNIFLNNFALGDKSEQKEFNITAMTGSSSFNKLNQGTDWLKLRSKEYDTTEKNYIITKEKVIIKKLDDYCMENKINQIDLVKIDTQGYEDKVLEGGINTIKGNKIKAIVTEIMFDDVYDKYFSFSDIEKYIVPHNFRLVGLNLVNNNLFTGVTFFADAYYFNKNYYNF